MRENTSEVCARPTVAVAQRDHFLHNAHIYRHTHAHTHAWNLDSMAGAFPAVAYSQIAVSDMMPGINWCVR